MALKSSLAHITEFVYHYWLPTLAGITYIHARSLLRRKEAKNHHRFRIALFAMEFIGDVVLTSALIRELRTAYPDAEITLLVTEKSEAVIELCPYVNQRIVLPVERSPWRKFVNVLRVYRRHFAMPFDLAILPRADLDIEFSALLCIATRATRRITITSSSRWLKRLLAWQIRGPFSDVLFFPEAMHETPRRLRILEFLGHEATAQHLECWLGKEDIAYERRFFNEQPHSSSARRIAFGIGASSAKRIWPTKNFTTLIQMLRQHLDFVPVLIAGPTDQAAARQIAEAVEGCLFTANTTLRQSSAILAECSLFVGNDSGPMHLAAAAGTPTIEISCHPLSGEETHSNSPVRFGPWCAQKAIVRPEAKEPACRLQCVSEDAHCIETITPEKVLSVVLRLLRSDNETMTASEHNDQNVDDERSIEKR